MVPNPESIKEHNVLSLFQALPLPPSVPFLKISLVSSLFRVTLGMYKKIWKHTLFSAPFYPKDSIAQSSLSMLFCTALFCWWWVLCCPWRAPESSLLRGWCGCSSVCVACAPWGVDCFPSLLVHRMCSEQHCVLFCFACEQVCMLNSRKQNCRIGA